MNLLSRISQSYYSEAKTIDEKEMDFLISQGKPVSDSFLQRIQPLIDTLQKSHPVALTVLQFDQMFIATKGSASRALLLVDEKQLENASDEALRFHLHHEWAHILHEDSATTLLIMNIAKPIFSIIVTSAALLSAPFNYKIPAVFVSYLGSSYLYDKTVARRLEMAQEIGADRFAAETLGYSSKSAKALFVDSVYNQAPQEFRKEKAALFEARLRAFDEMVEKPLAAVDDDLHHIVKA